MTSPALRACSEAIRAAPADCRKLAIVRTAREYGYAVGDLASAMGAAGARARARRAAERERQDEWAKETWYGKED